MFAISSKTKYILCWIYVIVSGLRSLLRGVMGARKLGSLMLVWWKIFRICIIRCRDRIFRTRKRRGRRRRRRAKIYGIFAWFLILGSLMRFRLCPMEKGCFLEFVLPTFRKELRLIVILSSWKSTCIVFMAKTCITASIRTQYN